MIKTYTECDCCQAMIKLNDIYVLVYYKQKGHNGNVRLTKTFCKKCYAVGKKGENK